MSAYRERAPSSEGTQSRSRIGHNISSTIYSIIDNAIVMFDQIRRDDYLGQTWIPCEQSDCLSLKLFHRVFKHVKYIRNKVIEIN